MRIQVPWCTVLAITAALATASRAEDAPTLKPTELVVTARAVEQPLMKYRFLPAEYELQDGNAAPILLRFPWQAAKYFSMVVPTFQEYLDLPLSDPKLVESGDVLKDRFYRELRRAAHLRTADWEYPWGEEPGVILLPDLQGAREIAGRGLSVWIRRHIAKGELSEAQEGIKVGLAVSRHYARTPFMVGQLVSVALDSMLLARIEELLAAPDCPNLYWALTALPRPLVDVRPSIELEERFLENTVDGLDDLEGLQTPKDWQQRWEEVVRYYVDGPPSCSAPSSADLLQTPSKEVLQAQQRILERARKELPSWTAGSAERVKAMSDAEAGLRWLVHRNREQAQRVAALMSLEPPAAMPALRALQDELNSFSSELGLPTLFVLKNPLSNYMTCCEVQRRIDALRAVEAIRHYAATHGGNFPASLKGIAETPVPHDLLTGRPFQYQVADGAAILLAPGIDVQGKSIGTIGYRIVLRE